MKVHFLQSLGEEETDCLLLAYSSMEALPLNVAEFCVSLEKKDVVQPISLPFVPSVSSDIIHLGSSTGNTKSSPTSC